MAAEYLPVDRRFRKEAQRAGELRKWEESLQTNIRCAKAIKEAISSHSAGGTLEESAAEKVLDQFGLQRVCFVLANSIRWRFSGVSDRVSDWGMSIAVPYDEKYMPQFSVNSDGHLLDAFVEQVWKARQALGLLGSEHCAENSDQLNYTGKVLVLNADSNDNGPLTLEQQLWYAADGIGCQPLYNLPIHAVSLADGHMETLNRAVFAGVLDEQYLPDWAAEKLAELRAPQQEQPEVNSGGMELR